MPIAGFQKDKCAFVTSNFGFGPVSKAATIAAEIKRRRPKTEIHFFGNGIALHFAKQSGSFDRFIETDVEDAGKIKKILAELKKYKIIFSVLNLQLLPLWRKSYGRLFFVDSLAWMWKEPPSGIENTDIYFVQDYLVSPERIESWKKTCRIETVSPIGVPPDSSFLKTGLAKRNNHLLVNFSGCSNQFVGSRIYENYAATLLSLIIEEAHPEFESIEVCVNQKLAQNLHDRFNQTFLKISQLPHQEFLQNLAAARFLLTAPGITTTLEAAVLKTPIGFLLPQNDSQAMVSEIYCRQFDESLTMAFSRFDKKLAFPTSMDDFMSLEQPVELAVQRMSLILENYPDKIKHFLRVMLSDPVDRTIKHLRNSTYQTGNRSGQSSIVSYVFGIIF